MDYSTFEKNLTVCPICLLPLHVQEFFGDEEYEIEGYFSAYCAPHLPFELYFPKQRHYDTETHFELSFHLSSDYPNLPQSFLVWNNTQFRYWDEADHQLIISKLQSLIEKYQGEELARKIRSIMSKIEMMI